MSYLNKETFICLDLETTGLDLENDEIIEVAVVKFTFDGESASFETLVDPGRPICEESMRIHHITNDMVAGKPKIRDIIPETLKLVGDHIIVGHGISFDIQMLCNAAKKHSIPCTLEKNRSIDTLRLARLYGECPTNSLERLRQHFNIPAEGAHRAMSDVIVNIEVFKKLTMQFTRTKDVFERLKKPIRLARMPLGKHKGRSFDELPHNYLVWASKQNFDQDLIFSIRSELRKRKTKASFSTSSNPFAGL